MKTSNIPDHSDFKISELFIIYIFLRRNLRRLSLPSENDTVKLVSTSIDLLLLYCFLTRVIIVMIVLLIHAPKGEINGRYNSDILCSITNRSQIRTSKI